MTDERSSRSGQYLSRPLTNEELDKAMDTAVFSKSDWHKIVIQAKEANALRAAALSEQTDRAEWLIWSNEHRAWWGPNKAGYPKDIRLAGRYTLTEARAICDQRSWDDLNVPPETMIHEAEVTGFPPSRGERERS